MNDGLAIPARIGGDGAIRFGETFVTPYAHIMRVEGSVLIVSEERDYGNGRREFCEVGRFQLMPISR